MKLQSKTNIYNIAYSAVILFAMGFFLQFLLVKTYYKQIDNSMVTEREIIEEEIEYLDTVPDYSAIFGHQIEVSILQTPVQSANKFSNFIQYNERTQTETIYRKHFFSKNRKNGMGYTISIMKPLSELNNFKSAVMVSISLAFLLLMFSFFGTGHFINRRLWKPFYTTLEELSHFNLDAPSDLAFEHSGTDEFEELNQRITSLSKKLKRDYYQMKEFSENLSHEINTMLAIIVSKIELLLQKEDLNPDQVEHFQTIYHVANNLSYLNRGLLLLAKIDNQYYSSTEVVPIYPIIIEHLKTFDDFVREKQINTVIESDHTSVVMNPILAKILVSNILNNAIKHNVNNGFIHIIHSKEKLSIINSAAPKLVPKDRLEALISSSVPLKSLGLGMEIVKRICQMNRFSIFVNTENDEFNVKIGFNTSSENK